MPAQIIGVQVESQLFDDLSDAFDYIGKQLDKAFDEAIVSVRPELLRALQRVASTLEQKHGNPWRGGVANSGPNLQTRTGASLRSIRQSIKTVVTSGDLIAAEISAAKLSFHEEGGTIRATRSQYLTIPLPAALDQRGVPLRERARAWDNTFVARSRKGNLLIFRRIPGAKEATPLYLLKTSVYVRPRLGMANAMSEVFGHFDQRLFEEISDIIDEHLP